ncbi:MAG: DUF2271 domain-containing protein [Phycisphaerae bacterium]
MRSPRRPWLLAAALQAALALPGPTVPGAEVASFHYDHILGTSLDLQLIAPSPEVAEAAHQAVLAEVERLRAILSTYAPTTDISRLNAAPVGQPVNVAPELFEVLHQYEHWRMETGGAYNPAIGALVKLWKQAQVRNTLPSETALLKEVKALQQASFTLDAAAGSVTRTIDRPLNIDSLGKGFIVSKVVATARARVPGLRGLLVNIGGDIATAGYAMLDRKVKWTLAIADPTHPEENATPLVTLMLTDLSVATSGGYARGYTIDGTTCSHILDPRTGRPVDASADGTPRKRAIAAATVIARDCATANALATTLCILTPEEGLALIRSNPGTECFLVLKDGAQVRSPGFRRYEVPRTDILEQSDAANTDGPRWPADFSVSIPLTIPPLEGRNAERPYVAVWIEDEQQQHVATLAVWGNDRRWLQEMPGWWKFGRCDSRLVAAVTRATRPAGQYKLAWSGKDQLGRQVPPGTYRVCVEVDYDHGGRVYRGAAIRCYTEASGAVIEASDTFGAISLTYGPRAAAAR